MEKSNKKHFWIPEEEVVPVSKKLQARPKEYDIRYSEHGAKLSSELKTIKTRLDQIEAEDTLSQLDFMVFKVALAKGEKIQNQERVFNNHGLSVNAVKKENTAIVSTTKARFNRLMRYVDQYTQTGRGKTNLEIIDGFELYSGQEKDSNSLQRTIHSQEVPETIDIQLMLLPNMSDEEYSSILEKLKTKLGDSHKSVYILSDNTPIIRAVITPSMLEKYENDSAIYRIEETDFFTVPPDAHNGDSIEDYSIVEGLDISQLPIVVVLDNGIKFPEFLKDIVVDQWSPDSGSGGDCSHGTRVASLIAFGNFKISPDNLVLVPRVRLIDCNILEDGIPVNELITRIQYAVTKYSTVSHVFNLSANAQNPIEGDEMSILGYELDILQKKSGVQFIVSAGNHMLWQYDYSLEEILDDDESIIASPGDSMLSIVVGAISSSSYENCVSKANQIAPYSRKGPGFNGFTKPDISAYAGVPVISDNGDVAVPKDDHSLSLSIDGMLSPDAGTSFSAPIISGGFAEILSVTDNNPLLAKALLFHTAQPLWDETDFSDEDLCAIHNLYGRGIINVEKCMYSSPSRVTYLRTGTLCRTRKERVKFYMPEVLAAQKGRNIARVTLTCISAPYADRRRGTEYIGSYVRTSLKKASDHDDVFHPVPPSFHEGHQNWDVCSHLSKLFSNFNAGDWQVWLELFSRWENKDEEVPYALAITIEDLSGDLDIYEEIQNLQRFKTSPSVRARV